MGEIRIRFNIEKNQVEVSAPMADQQQKDMTINILLTAIKCVVDFKPSILLKAAGLPGHNGNGNGKPILGVN